jgi:hypothetical protein
MMFKLFNDSRFLLCLLLLVLLPLPSMTAGAQTPKRTVQVFLDLKETNLDEPSTVATNTLSERLSAAGFRVTTKRREATLIVEGTIASRPTPVTDEAKREGGVNAEASASVRLLVGTEVIATSVERTAPGDWGVQAQRVGEDRLIEVAGRIADDLFTDDLMPEMKGDEGKSSPPKNPTPAPVGPGKPTRAPAKKARRGVSFLEVMSLVQNSAPEERIVTALRKHGIKFKPLDGALSQLRSVGASETLISAVKNCHVVS